MQDSVTLAPWQALLVDAQAQCHVSLPDTLESYLVLLLIRYLNKPELTDSVLGLDYLNAHNREQGATSQTFRDIGDRCLLFSGLFPRWANKRQVSLSYCIELGQSAYGSAANLSRENESLWLSLSEQFILLRDVLHATRHESSEGLPHVWLEALNLWSETNSPYAKQVAGGHAGHILIDPSSDGAVH